MRTLAISIFLLLAVAAGARVLARAVPAPAAPDPRALLAEADAAPAPGSTRAPVRVPILVYHIVRPAYASDSAAVRAMRVTPEVFTAELQWLADAGYQVIPFAALDAHLARGAALPAHPVVVTLDDAWEDQYQYAFPILKQFRYPATFFVPSGYPGSNTAFITWNELREMVGAGMSVGSHSATHPYLARITSSSTLAAEIAGSKAKLEAELGIPIEEFAYPFGQYDRAVLAEVAAAGYEAARIDAYTASSSEANLYTLPGLNAPTSLAGFMRYFPRASP